MDIIGIKNPYGIIQHAGRRKQKTFKKKQNKRQYRKSRKSRKSRK